MSTPRSRTTEESVNELGDEYILDLGRAPRYQTLVAFLKSHAELACDNCLQVTVIDWEDRIDVCRTCSRSASSTRSSCALRSIARPEIDTISHLFHGANWHEREAWEMYGVVFAKHPDLRRLFLPDDIEGFPMRKDFSDASRVVERPY